MMGLLAPSKSLPSKYFYDKKGDELFIKIMDMPEYYLTNSEFEVLSTQGFDILEKLGVADGEFDIYELGAGDGRKTIELLKYIDPTKTTYHAIDISQNALDVLVENFRDAIPQVNCEPLCGDYFEILDSLDSDRPKLVLFLGSNLGNLSDKEASEFISMISDKLEPGDHLLLGLDLKKSGNIILPAYNDPHGYTRDFNLNLLARINRELGANFDLNNFEHAPTYDEKNGMAYSFLRSKIAQDVYFASSDITISFGAGETIHTEISRKYDKAKLEEIIDSSEMIIAKEFTDTKNYFTDFLLRKT